MSTATHSGSSSLAIIGAGMASARLIHELVAGGFDGSITLYGEEPCLPYNRVQLSALLAGDQQASALPMLEQQWCEQQDITLELGSAVTQCDVAAKTITNANGNQQFDQIVFATGSNPVMPSIEGMYLAGVKAFRTLVDVEQFQQLAQLPNQKAIVVGGGLLGLEAAYGLNKLGVDVTVINRASYVMNKQLDESAANLLQHSLEQRGITIHTSANVAAIVGEEKVNAVQLISGEELPANLVIFAVGVSPNVGLAKQAGLQVNRGVVVDESLQTSALDVYAIGECTECAGQTLGIVAPIWEQVSSLVATLCHQVQPYQPQVHATQLKVSGIDLFSAGSFEQDTDNSQDIVISDSSHGIYRRLVIAEDTLQGALLLGDKTNSNAYETLIKNQQPVANQLEELMFAPVD